MTKGDHVMQDFRQGKEAALDDLMQFYIKPLTFFAHKMILNKEGAEEIVSDSFLKLWRGREGFNTKENVKAFLYITTRNACLDYIKSPQNQPVRKTELTEEPLSPAKDVLTQIIHAELIEIIDKELNHIPEQYARIFRMSFFQELTTAEICQQLGISENAVFTARSKARQYLKVAFRQKGLILYAAFVHFVAP